MSLLTLGVGKHVTSGAVATTFDPAATNANIALSAGNLTATRSGASGDATTKSTTSRSNGMVTFTATATPGGSQSLGVSGSGLGLGDWLGIDANSCGWCSNGNVLFNGGTSTTWSTYFNGDVLDIIWKGGKMYGRKNGGSWEGGADPVAGTGGITVTGLGSGAAFAALDLTVSGAIVSADFNPASPPSGVNAWG